MKETNAFEHDMESSPATAWICLWEEERSDFAALLGNDVQGWRGLRKGVGGLQGTEERQTCRALGQGLTAWQAASGGCKPPRSGRQPGAEMLFPELRS